MKDVGQRAAEAAALKSATPYVRLFKGKTFVLKAGGAALEGAGAVTALIEQVEVLHQLGIRTVLVHGGGTQSSALARALGAEPRFVAGRRVTDEAALEVATLMLNGSINTRLLAACRRTGLPAIGTSGVAAGLIVARRRPPVALAAGGEPVDYGLVGDIVAVDPTVLHTLLAAGLVPVVSPLSADARGALLNINADTVAAALAVALDAEKLILLTGGPGILERPDDPRSLVSYTDLRGLARLREQGCLASGMLPKASAIESAIRGGVPRVHIISGQQPDSLLVEVFTNQGCGTLVVEDVHVLAPAELAPAGPAPSAETSSPAAPLGPGEPAARAGGGPGRESAP
ncbi:MAG TPA: acetylglutamate kinase [Thermoanaerobaculia bacterium]|nr:acetylglutamate kinase [Thermoanaerobaculia bacterium]